MDMTIPPWLATYGAINLLLGLACVSLLAGRRRWGPSEAEALAAAGRVLLLAALLLPPLALALPAPALVSAAPQVFGGLVASAAEAVGAAALQTSARQLASAAHPSTSVGLQVALLLAFAAAAARPAFAWRRLKGLLSRATQIAAAGRVRVVVSAEVRVPLSAWRPGQAWVVIPEAMLGAGDDPDAWRLALSHELQHHRQRDTLWVYVFAALKTLCFWNPFVHRLVAESVTLGEHRCDLALLRRGVSPRRYASCLLQVAEAAARAPGAHNPWVCAALDGTQGTLTRRVQLMTAFNHRSPRSRRGLTVAALALPLMAATALATAASAAAPGATALDMAAVQAAVAAHQGGFALVVNPQVTGMLERMVGLPQWRAFLNEGMKRLPEHRATIDPILTQAGLPLELVAVVLIESGAQNLQATSEATSLAQGHRGAGLWMFIPDTARAYDLVVEGDVDERLDIPKQTQAAARLLGDMHTRYGDWGLALAAYNQGPKAVDAAIELGGSRDPWALIAKGHLNDYAARVMAAAILMSDPSLLPQ